MQVQTPHEHLELPPGMRSKLEDFRRRVWLVKLAEGVLAAVFGLLISYILVFLLDRLWDTPRLLRVTILLTGAAGLGIWFPLKWHRWVWRTRQLEQVARLLRHRFPRLGDQLLGIVELVHSEVELERSMTLCRAAMKQVDDDTRDRDFTDAVPSPRHRRWAVAVAVPLLLALAAMIVVPAAGTNALMRWLMPWSDTPRYTFAQLEQLPDKMYVPFAEPFELQARLSDQTVWSPAEAVAQYEKQPAVRAELQEKQYDVALPPQKDAGSLTIRVGDYRKKVAVEPTTRPELQTLLAEIDLPAYLQYSTALSHDVRSGTVSIVQGSRVRFDAAVTRALRAAMMDGKAIAHQDSRFTTDWMDVRESSERQFQWVDHLGLSPKQPFLLRISSVDDRAPTISASATSNEQVILVGDVLTFDVLAQDEFGVKLIGIEWQGIKDPLRNPNPSAGETVVALGSPEQRDLSVQVAFSTEREGIPPQSLAVRMFTVDYLPDRERVYSPTYIVHVLTADEHAIWLTNQLRKWFRQSQDVYEREQQLYETNKELRDLPADQLDRPETRRRIETQAAAEQANARRLDALTDAGDQLIQQATRNDQFNVQTLENWASMLQALKNIAANRMPTVADLLSEAAQAPAGPAGEPQPPGQPPQDAAKDNVGVNRDPRAGKGQETKPGESPKLPTISDVESGFNDLNDPPESDGEPPEAGSGRLTLPSTVVQGGGEPGEGGACPAQEKVAQAVEEQEDLLAEFAKVADELQKILENLEGSTFVKRLKAASRRQLEVATDVNNSLDATFGTPDEQLTDRNLDKASSIAEREIAQSDNVYVIQEDLEAYYNRVQDGKFKTVLNEMREEQVVRSLREVAATVRDNMNGHSIAQTEFWADALDRWAEQLVGPG